MDAALRARVSEFYQDEIAQKFAQALQLVADDTKDLFIGSSKPSYLTFEIKNIKYSDDFSKAEVMLLVTRLLPIQGFMGHPLPTKMNSRWKVENGKWCYYVDPKLDLPNTPFGGLPMPSAAMPPNAVPGLPAGAPPALPMPGAGSTPPAQPPMPAHLADARMLKPDKKSVQLKAGSASSDQVTIANTSPWYEGLTFDDPKVPGLSLKLDHASVNPREKAVLTVSWNGGAAPKNPVTIQVTVSRTQQKIPITVTFNN